MSVQNVGKSSSEHSVSGTSMDVNASASGVLMVRSTLSVTGLRSVGSEPSLCSKSSEHIVFGGDDDDDDANGAEEKPPPP
jgi:hypothetical protein